MDNNNKEFETIGSNSENLEDMLPDEAQLDNEENIAEFDGGDFMENELTEEMENYVPDSEFYDSAPNENFESENNFSQEKPTKKKKKWFSFGKKNKDDFDEKEDLYYGISMKPLAELRKGFDEGEDIGHTGDVKLQEETFAKLFDDTLPSLDDEVEKNFQRIQMERRRRVAEAVESAGVDVDEVADELGIIAPMPVTSFAADPYAKQHGIDTMAGEEAESVFQKASMETAKSQTMEIKLNVLNDTIELQKNLNIPSVGEADLVRVREGQAEETEEKQDQAQEPVFAVGNDVTSYREKSLPVHFLNIDIIQSALLSEIKTTAETEEKAKAAKPFSRFAIRNDEDLEEESTESIDDYTSPSDAKSIATELKGLMKTLSMRMIVTVISALVLLISSFVCEGSENNGTAITYLVLNTIFMLVPISLCYKNLLGGFASLMKFEATSDSAVAVAGIAALVQIVVGFFNVDKIAAGTVHLYGAVVVFILLINCLGKISMVKRIYGNFRFISSRETKFAVKKYADYNTALKLAGDSVAEAPSIAYQQKAGFLKRFLELSYKNDPAEKASHAMAPFALVCSLLLCLICLFVTRDVAVSVTILAAAACVTTPLTNILGLNKPISKLCAKVRRAGSMVVGFEGVEAMASTNAIMLDSSELFPEGTVVLDGVKTFGSDPEKAIYAATAIIKEVGGVLSDVFSQVINERENDIPNARGIILEDENGISGLVEGQKILIGNRAILMNHGITPPEREAVVKYTAGGKKALFVAVDGQLEAMLVLSYRADKRKRIELQKLESHGVSLVVRSTDANITKKFLSSLFGIAESSISVVCGSLGDVYKNILETEISRADAVVATKGRPESFMNVVSSCIEQKKTMGLIIAIQNISIIIGFVLVAFLSIFSGATQLTAIALLLYEVFWLAVVLLVPKINLK